MIRRHPIPHAAPERPPILPAYGGMPCVWMSAGLVAYKLCDRGFECEGCPFDRAMRGALPPRPRPEDEEPGRGDATRRGGSGRPFRVGRGRDAGPTIEDGSGTGRAVSRDHGASFLHRVVS